MLKILALLSHCTNILHRLKQKNCALFWQLVFEDKFNQVNTFQLCKLSFLSFVHCINQTQVNFFNHLDSLIFSLEPFFVRLIIHFSPLKLFIDLVFHQQLNLLNFTLQVIICILSTNYTLFHFFVQFSSRLGNFCLDC